jgi:hypothetical protein
MRLPFRVETMDLIIMRNCEVNLLSIGVDLDYFKNVLIWKDHHHPLKVADFFAYLLR